MPADAWIWIPNEDSIVNTAFRWKKAEKYDLFEVKIAWYLQYGFDIYNVVEVAVIAIPIFNKNIREAFLLAMRTVRYIQFGW